METKIPKYKIRHDDPPNAGLKSPQSLWTVSHLRFCYFTRYVCRLF